MNNDRNEEKNRRKGLIFSFIFHTTLIVLLAFFGLSWQSPPPEPGGILVNLGIPDVGQGNENAPEGNPAPPVEEEKPEPKEETPPPKEETKPEPKKETKPEPTPQKEVKKTEDPNAAALRKKKEEERKKAEAEAKAKAEEDRKKREAEAKAKAEEAAKKAEEDRKRKELEDLVSGGLSGSGSGKGNTGKPGNQGDPGGDPNAGALSGISTGSGTVGGGLTGRGYQRPNPPKDNSQATGVVVVYVCVDKNGNVTSAEYTQSGSTTADSNLKRIAIENAKKYKFDRGSVDKQCGTIRYDFKLK